MAVDLNRMSPTSQLNEALRRSAYEADAPRTAEDEAAQMAEALALSIPPKTLVDCAIPAGIVNMIAAYTLALNHEDHESVQPELVFEAFTGNPAVSQDNLRVMLRSANGAHINQLLRRNSDDVDLLPAPYRALIQQDLATLNAAKAENAAFQAEQAALKAQSPDYVELVPPPLPHTIQSTVVYHSLAVASGVTVEKVRKLATTFPFITSLTLSGTGTGIDDECVATIVELLPNLNDVDFNNNGVVSHLTANSLAKLTKLKVASLLGCYRIDSAHRDMLRARGVEVRP